VRMDMFRMSKESNEYDLGSGVEVDSRSKEEIKERDSKTRLCPLGGQGKKNWEIE